MTASSPAYNLRARRAKSSGVKAVSMSGIPECSLSVAGVYCGSGDFSQGDLLRAQTHPLLSCIRRWRTRLRYGEAARHKGFRTVILMAFGTVPTRSASSGIRHLDADCRL